jgi:hypothetical protein
VVASGCTELSSLYLNVTSRLKQRPGSGDESVGSKVVREPRALLAEEAHPGSTSCVRLTILDDPLEEEEATRDPNGRGIWLLPRTLTARLGGFNLWVLLYIQIKVLLVSRLRVGDIG